MNTEALLATVQTRGIDIGLKLLGALIAYVAGRWLISLAVSLMKRALTARNVDATVQRYLGNILSVLLNIALVVALLGYFGIQTTSFAALFAAAGVAIGRRHAASSYTFFQHDNAWLDMVRTGMVLYGVYPDPGFRKGAAMDLRPAVALRARVVYVKKLAAGTSAGYERAYVAKQDTWVATLPVGHTDGWPRVAAKGARVRINNRLYPVIASVSASHSIVEIGAEQTVRIGDVATMFDWTDGSRPEDVATSCGASVYDLLMHLNPLLPRFVLTEA